MSESTARYHPCTPVIIACLSLEKYDTEEYNYCLLNTSIIIVIK